MITVEMIKKYLPNDIEVVERKNGNVDANIFICSFPEKYMINGCERKTKFVFTISHMEQLKINTNHLIDRLRKRCDVAYAVGLAHHQKYVDRIE